jgi:hypothetical protein
MQLSLFWNTISFCVRHVVARLWARRWPWLLEFLPNAQKANHYVAAHLQTFWHSSSHALGEALEAEFGADLTIGPALEEGFYYDCYLGDRVLSEADKPRIQKHIDKVGFPDAASPGPVLALSSSWQAMCTVCTEADETCIQKHFDEVGCWSLHATVAGASACGRLAGAWMQEGTGSPCRATLGL